MSFSWKRHQVRIRRALGVRRPRMLKIRVGATPGTLEAPESQQGQPARLSLIMYSPEEFQEFEPKTVEECLELASRNGIAWINVDGLGQPEVLAKLGERFGLHPLELEDVLSVPQRPKLEAYANHHFMIVRMVRLTREIIEEEQVSLFLGPNFVLTIQERTGGDVFDPVRERIRHNRGRIRAAGADYLAYSLLDAVIDGFFPVLEVLGERMETLEDEVIESRTPELISRIHGLRRELLALRRTIWATREVPLALQRESDLISPETRIFMRDCQDHAVECLELVETYRETAASLMEVYLSTQNQRLNEVMKVLTVMATIFIPLTFIASIYGMNFEHMPELKWPYAYPAVLGLMGVVALGLTVYFRRRGWW